MSTAITLALLSLAAAGLLDVSFKRYSRKARSRGIYLAICGAAWAFLQLSYYSTYEINISLDGNTIWFGTLAGVCLAIANLTFIESLGRLNVSVGSTIYRLNTVGVVLLSLLLLGEPIGIFKVLGVLVAIVSVWMLCDSPVGKEVHGQVAVFLWLAILASALRAVFGVIAKAGLNAGANAETVVLIYAVSWIPAGLIYGLLREKNIKLSRDNIAYGTASGIILCLVANFLIEAMKLGDASTVVPIANLSFIVALVISVILGMEKLTWRKSQALFLAGVAIYFFAQT